MPPANHPEPSPELIEAMREEARACIGAPYACGCRHGYCPSAYAATETRIATEIARAVLRERERCKKIVQRGVPEGPVYCDRKACILAAIEEGIAPGTSLSGDDHADE